MQILTDTPRARTTDPETSHMAAEEIKVLLGAQQECVRAMVLNHPGKTSAELAYQFAKGISFGRDTHWAEVRPMFARRLPELEPVHIKKGIARTCSITRKQCVTWWPV